MPSPAAWRELGLSPTRDLAAIRRAYAARLRQVRPDQDAAGFRALREAYEQVLAWAREEQPDAARWPDEEAGHGAPEGTGGDDAGPGAAAADCGRASDAGARSGFPAEDLVDPATGLGESSTGGPRPGSDLSPAGASAEAVPLEEVYDPERWLEPLLVLLDRDPPAREDELRVAFEAAMAHGAHASLAQWSGFGAALAAHLAEHGLRAWPILEQAARRFGWDNVRLRDHDEPLRRMQSSLAQLSRAKAQLQDWRTRHRAAFARLERPLPAAPLRRWLDGLVDAPLMRRLLDEPHFDGNPLAARAGNPGTLAWWQLRLPLLLAARSAALADLVVAGAVAATACWPDAERSAAAAWTTAWGLPLAWIWILLRPAFERRPELARARPPGLLPVAAALLPLAMMLAAGGHPLMAWLVVLAMLARQSARAVSMARHRPIPGADPWRGRWFSALALLAVACWGLLTSTGCAGPPAWAVAALVVAVLSAPATCIPAAALPDTSEDTVRVRPDRRRAMAVAYCTFSILAAAVVEIVRAPLRAAGEAAGPCAPPLVDSGLQGFLPAYYACLLLALMLLTAALGKRPQAPAPSGT